MRQARNIPGLLVDFPTVMNSLFSDDLLKPLSNNWTVKPAINIAENENSFGIEVVAPGFDKQAFNVKIENNKLSVSAQKSEEANDEATKYTVKEFTAMSFERTFNLPKNTIDEENVSANYDNGILKIILPKREEAKQKAPKQIAIQ